MSLVGFFRKPVETAVTAVMENCAGSAAGRAVPANCSVACGGAASASWL